MRRILFGAVAFAITFLPFIACVGEDPGSSGNASPDGGDAGPLVGDYLGPCFEDGTCKTGLECDAQLKRCKRPGQELEGGTPADSGGDAPGDSGNDAASACPGKVLDLGDTNKIGCATGNQSPSCDKTQGLVCCYRPNVVECTTSAACTTMPSSTTWSCSSWAQCTGAGRVCCLNAHLEDAGAVCAPHKVIVDGPADCANGPCGTGAFPLCVGGAAEGTVCDLDSVGNNKGVCRATDLLVGGQVLTVKLCMTQ
jgi:hypothetical protein